MKKIYSLLVFCLFMFAAQANMILTGVLDGPLSGGTKVLEIYVVNDIPDLTIYGVGVANNGGGSDGQEFTFPAGSATAGQFIYITNNAANCLAYLGFNADYVNGTAAGFNGDDGIELYENGTIIDVFGDSNVLGTGTAWEYLDTWAYRVDGTGPDGATFVEANWDIRMPNMLDPETVNGGSTDPWPFGTYVYTAAAFPTVSFQGTGISVNEAAGTVTVNVGISSPDGNPTSVDIMVGAGSTATGADYSLGATTVTFPASSSAAESVIVTIVDDAMMEATETIELMLANPTNSAAIGANSTFTISIGDNDTPVPDIVINEIMYNNPGTDEFEFLELYNNDSAPVDLNGFTFTAGITHTFAIPTVLNPGDYLVLCTDIDSMNFYFPLVSNAIQWDGGALGNGGEKIQLEDAAGNVVDSLTYDDTGVWSGDADGFGPSLELCDPNEDNGNAFFWFPGTNPTGVTYGSTMAEILATPGAANTAVCASTDNPVLAFVDGSQTVNEADGTISVDVHIAFGNANPTSVDVEVNAASTATTAVDFLYTTATVNFPAGVAVDTMSITLNIVDDYDPESIEDIVLSLANPTNSATIDVPADHVISILDDDTPVVDLVITEIMYNNPGTDTLEYLEIYNNDGVAVDLQGYFIDNAIDHTFDESVILNPGDYLVLTVDSVAFESVFGFAAFQWDAGAINNGGEPIELYNNAGNLLDVVEYDDVTPWPNTPDGDGPSLELCDVDSDNNDGTNWAASSTNTGIVIGGSTIYGTPGAANFCVTGPLVHFRFDGFSILEDFGVLNLQVVLEDGTGPVSFDLELDAASTAMMGDDFTLALTGHGFTGDNVADTISIPLTIIDDVDVEDLETVILNLVNVTGATAVFPASYNLEIADNDAVSVKETLLEDLDVYPNPTNGLLNIEAGFELDEIHLTDMLGKRVISDYAMGTQARLDVSNLPMGVYFLTVVSEGNQATLQVVVK